MMNNSVLTRQQYESWSKELERRNKQLQDDLTNQAISSLKVVNNLEKAYSEIKSLKLQATIADADFSAHKLENKKLKSEVKRLNDLYVPDDYCSGNCFDCKFDIELDDNGNNPVECKNCLCNFGIKDHFVKKGE